TAVPGDEISARPSLNARPNTRPPLTQPRRPSKPRVPKERFRTSAFLEMDVSMSSRLRWAPILVVMASAAATLVAVPSIHKPLLRTAGWALVVNEPLAPADFIVVAPESGGAGALEAADLVQSGIATRVAVFVDPPSVEEHEFIRRGLPYEDTAA